jgi:hypothetical protein
VKNPYVRALSAYLDKIDRRTDPFRKEFCHQHGIDEANDISFHDFLAIIRTIPASAQNAHWRQQAHNLLLGGLTIDFVGHVEHFAEDFAALAAQTGLRIDAGIVRAGMSHATSAEGRLADLCGSKEAALVNEIYEEDFLAFGYRFDPANVGPQRRNLSFAITDPALHHFIAGVGLLYVSPESAAAELHKAKALADAHAAIAECLAALERRAAGAPM